MITTRLERYAEYVKQTDQITYGDDFLSYAHMREDIDAMLKRVRSLQKAEESER